MWTNAHALPHGLSRMGAAKTDYDKAPSQVITDPAYTTRKKSLRWNTSRKEML